MGKPRYAFVPIFWRAVYRSFWRAVSSSSGGLQASSLERSHVFNTELIGHAWSFHCHNRSLEFHHHHHSSYCMRASSECSSATFAGTIASQATQSSTIWNLAVMIGILLVKRDLKAFDTHDRDIVLLVDADWQVLHRILILFGQLQCTATNIPSNYIVFTWN